MTATPVSQNSTPRNLLGFLKQLVAPSDGAPAETGFIQGVVLVDAETGLPVSGEPVSIADGADVAQGTKADAAVTDPTAAGSVIALLKGLLTFFLGAPSTARLLSSAASTNGTRVKATAGRIYSVQGYNASSGVIYLKLYESALNPPVVGTTTPRKTIPIPPNTVFAFDWPSGLPFASGIGYGLTTGSADNSTAAVGAGDILGLNVDYA
jgi:hypothetical protein